MFSLDNKLSYWIICNKIVNSYKFGDFKLFVIKMKKIKYIRFYSIDLGG